MNNQQQEKQPLKPQRRQGTKDIKKEETMDDEWEEKEEAKFVRKLKRGTGKYKDKLPFKCFNCGRIGHYAKKCPFDENKGFYKKKSLYSKEDNNSTDESDGEETKSHEVLFITQETKNNEHKISKINETISKGECISDLIGRQKKTNMKQEIF